MTGESMSPRTRQPIRSKPSRKAFELWRSCVMRLAASPAVLGSVDDAMMSSSAESACCAAGGDMDGA